MNRNDFLGMVSADGPLDRQSIVEVTELIKIFPYFQSAHLLLLKGLRNTSDVRFESQLKSSALHIADREVLYYFLQKERKSDTPTQNELPEKREFDREQTEHEQTVIESAKNSADLIAAIEKEEKPVRLETEDVRPTVFAHHEVMKEEADDESSASILIIDEDSGAVEEKIIYMDPGFSINLEEELLELEGETVSELSVPEKAENDSQEQPEAVTGRKKKQAELIDKFIETNPRIEPVKVRADAPVEDISKPFVESKGGLVTETLARIYINQGYYSRAIDIYERLSLNYPEKSSYFATQIEKVRELIK